MGYVQWEEAVYGSPAHVEGSEGEERSIEGMSEVQDSPKVLGFSFGEIRREWLVVPVPFPLLAMLVGGLIAKGCTLI